jgi:hypothetical protein
MMTRVKLPAVGVAAVACFVLGALWYSPLLFGNVYSALRSIDSGATSAATPPLGELFAEVVRCFVTAYAFAILIMRLRVDGVKGAVALALLVWIGFQGFVLIGSVIHEGYPVALFHPPANIGESSVGDQYYGGAPLVERAHDDGQR